MRFRNRAVAFLITGVLLMSGLALAGGCGGGSGSSGSAGLTLGGEDTRATSATADHTATAAATLEPTVYLTEELLTKAASPTRAETYPIVTLKRESASTTVTVDYGANPVTTTGGRQVSGVFVLTLDRADRSGRVEYQNVTINGHGVSGTTTLSNIVLSQEKAAFDSVIDLNFVDYGRIRGTLSASFTRGTEIISLPTGSLILTPEDSATYEVRLSNIVIDPKSNGNFVPEAGRTTVSYVRAIAGQPITVNTVITYSEQTPQTGLVGVSVNGTGSVPYTLPRFQ